MTDDYDKPYRYQVLKDIGQELKQLDLAKLHRVLRYCQTLAAEQPTLFDTAQACPVCGKQLVKPARGPMPRFCSAKCKQKNYRLAKQART